MKSFEDTIEFHGHSCPGLALGWRVGTFALAQMGERSDDEELVAIVENDSCAVDGVQVVTGCTFGKGNFIFRDHGKQVYTFIKRPSGETLRVALKWKPPGESPEEKDAWQRYSSGERSKEVSALVHARKSKKIKAILDATDEELFSVSNERARLPETARIHPSVECEICGEKTMETRLRILGDKKLCLPCFEKAQED